VARTNLPLQPLVGDGGANVTFTAADVANGMNVQPVGQGERDSTPILILVTGTATVTVDAGVQYPAGGQANNALATAFAVVANGVVGPISSSRWSQADQSMNLDFSGACTVAAVQVPLAK
jgi:hypothetical protein